MLCILATNNQLKYQIYIIAFYLLDLLLKKFKLHTQVLELLFSCGEWKDNYTNIIFSSDKNETFSFLSTHSGPY